MKKMLLAWVLCLALSLCALAEPALSVVPSGERENTDASGTTERADAEVLVPCQATLEDRFDASMVLVTLKRDFSSPLRAYGEEYFDLQAEGLEFSSVEQVYYYETEEEAARCIQDLDDFHALFKLFLKEPGKQTVLAAIRELEKREDVLSASPNRIYTVDTEDEASMAETPCADASVNSTGDELLTDDPLASRDYKYEIPLTSIDKAWEMSKGSASVRVGIIDDGIDFSHPDLTANCDQALSANFTGDGLGAAHFTDGHGTQIAGIIGAVANNQIGATGVCWNVKLVSLRVVAMTEDGSETITSEAIADAVNYAAQNDIPILNISLGGKETDLYLKTAIKNYPGLIVCAAGNGGKNIDAVGEAVYPACYDRQNILTVGNSSSFDWMYITSNYGATSVDLFAPGTAIKTTDLNHGYFSVKGTSYAAPVVAGVAALIKSYNPALTTDQIRRCIMRNVDKSSDFSGKCVTGGRLNAYNALLDARKLSICDYATVSGDFNGDGKDDYIAFCGTGEHTDIVMWDAATRNGFGTTLISSDWFATSGVAGRVVSGDVDADGRDEILALYDYGNFVKLWRFKIDEDGNFLCDILGETGICDPYCMYNLVAAGDFDNDGRDEMFALYDYGDNVLPYLFGVNADGTMKFYSVDRVNSFYGSNVRGRVTGGDFDGDGQDEIATFYGYDYGTDLPYMRMWMFKISSDGTLGYSCLGQTGWWEAPNINGRVTAGDYDQDGLDEVAVLYDYGSKVKLWLFERNADGTMAHDVILETKIITGADATGRMFSGTYSTLGGEEVGILYTTTLRSELCVMGLTDEHVGYNSRYF